MVDPSGGSKLAGHEQAGSDVDESASARASCAPPVCAVSRQQNAPPGFSGGGLQSWALVGACFEHLTLPRTHLPPADVQALPVADDEDVHADRTRPSTTNIQAECMAGKLPHGRLRSSDCSPGASRIWRESAPESPRCYTACMLRLLVACCVISAIGCTSEAAEHADASPGRMDGDSEAATGLIPCDDRTGATDCCPGGVTSGGRCSTSATPCWTACDFSLPMADARQGYRSEMTCSGGHWTAGHGLFPCSPTDASAPLPACTWKASLYHTDGSANLCFAARTNTVCTGVNGCTVECLVNDPSRCPGPSNGSCQSSLGDTGPMACANTCKPDEYAVECEASGLGGQGPFAVPPSGSGCHADTTAPQSAEAAYYCCPCGT